MTRHSQSARESEAGIAPLKVKETALGSDKAWTEETVVAVDDAAVVVETAVVMVAPERRRRLPEVVFLTTQQRRPRQRSVLLGSLETNSSHGNQRDTKFGK